jgi:hypothetical protein
MKTILAIDDDVLVAAMAIAQTDDRDLGQVISELARRALPRPPTPMRRATLAETARLINA